MGEHPVGLQMLAAKAGDGANSLIDAQEAPVGRDFRNADGGVLVSCRQALLLLERQAARKLERGVSMLTLGDVEKTIDCADHLAFGVTQRIDVERHNDAPAV